MYTIAPFCSLNERCADVREDLREAACECYKEMPNKEERIDELAQCMTSNGGNSGGRPLPPFIKRRMLQKVCNVL